MLAYRNRLYSGLIANGRSRERERDIIYMYRHLRFDLSVVLLAKWAMRVVKLTKSAVTTQGHGLSCCATRTTRMTRFSLASLATLVYALTPLYALSLCVSLFLPRPTCFFPVKRMQTFYASVERASRSFVAHLAREVLFYTRIYTCIAAE